MSRALVRSNLFRTKRQLQSPLDDRFTLHVLLLLLLPVGPLEVFSPSVEIHQQPLVHVHVEAVHSVCKVLRDVLPFRHH